MGHQNKTITGGIAAKKRYTVIAAMLILWMIFSAILPITGFAGDGYPSATATTEFQIKITHTNDIHARVAESGGMIGAARLKTVIENWSAGSDMDLVVDSGDLFHGQPIATLVQGESIARIVKALGYDVMTAGNHDWSYGKDRLRELCGMADIQMLCGNVTTDSGKPFFDSEFYIEEVTKSETTLKVGMFGVIDPDLYRSTAPANVAGLTFTDPAAYAKSAAAALREQGCDIVIALSHTYDPQKLAEKVDGVNVWLCGHEHIDLNTTVTTPCGDTAYIVESGYYLYGASLIEINCTLDESGNMTGLTFQRQTVTAENAADYDKDASVTALLEEISEEQKSVLRTAVGKTPEDLDGDWYRLRIDETHLGRVVTDAYLLETGADVAFENAGGIRASVAAGDVTYGDIIGVSPYGNYIVTKEITGRELIEILETSLEIQRQCIEAYEQGDDSVWPSSSGSYLQCGGISVIYDLTKPQGSRVLSVRISGEALDETKLYTVATNNYVAASRYYTSLANAEETGQFSACDEALVSYFKQSEEVIAKSLSSPRMIQAKDCPHTNTEIRNAKDTACTQEGYTGDTYCTDCGAMIQAGVSIQAGHTFENGKCTVCGAADPNTKQTESQNPGNQTDAESPQTGDGSHAEIYVILLLLSASALTAFTYKKHREI